jgi:endonuclease/exonuclease/phosphatase (EEP) superfamily protein YafD
MGWINLVLSAIVARRYGRWICAGDFNASPAAVAALPVVTANGLQVVSNGNGSPTQQSGGELDLAVCAGKVVTDATVQNSLGSDHWPVHFA